MDKTYRKTVIGMIIPAVLAAIVVSVMTVAQKSIIHGVGRVMMQNWSVRQIMSAYGDLTHAGNGTVVPFYMFFCVFVAFIVIAATIIVISNPKFKDKPKMAVPLFVLYGIAPVFGTIYTTIGGDKLLTDPKLEANITILSTMISFVVSPIMIFVFVFFVMTVVKFIRNAKRAQREAA